MVIRLSLYVQLSRCRSLDSTMLISKARGRDFVGNKVAENMVAASLQFGVLWYSPPIYITIDFCSLCIADAVHAIRVL
jgi:hypothetical protein